MIREENYEEEDINQLREGARSWRGPTFPWLKPEYHRRRGLSGSSSRWDRLYIPRHTHQLVAPFQEVDQVQGLCVLKFEL